MPICSFVTDSDCTSLPIANRNSRTEVLLRFAFSRNQNDVHARSDFSNTSYHFAFQRVKPAGFLRSEVRSSVRSGGGALRARQSYLFECEMVSAYPKRENRGELFRGSLFAKDAGAFSGIILLESGPFSCNLSPVPGLTLPNVFG